MGRPPIRSAATTTPQINFDTALQVPSGIVRSIGGTDAAIKMILPERDGDVPIGSRGFGCIAILITR
jgi:hypothetical protein